MSYHESRYHLNDSHGMHIDKEIFELIFPAGIFEWFELKEGRSDAQNAYLTLEEKDMPPLTDENKHKTIVARKFHDITITDFPLRGKRTLLTIRRRYWKLEGQTEYLARDLKLCFSGTRLEQQFADFLKAPGGDPSRLARVDRDGEPAPAQRV